MIVRKFSLIELVVVAAILAVLISLLSPSLQSVLGKGLQVQCMNNQKAISMAIHVYQNDNNDIFPYGMVEDPSVISYSTFGIAKPNQELLLDYLNEPKNDYICPADETPEDYWWWRFRDHANYLSYARGSSYMFSEHMILGFALTQKKQMTLNDIIQPSTLGYMSDGRAYPNGWNWSKANYYDDRSRVDWSHLDMNNFLFADGHVESILSLETGEVRTMPWRL